MRAYLPQLSCQSCTHKGQQVSSQIRGFAKSLTWGGWEKRIIIIICSELNSSAESYLLVCSPGFLKKDSLQEVDFLEFRNMMLEAEPNILINRQISLLEGKYTGMQRSSQDGSIDESPSPSSAASRLAKRMNGSNSGKDNSPQRRLSQQSDSQKHKELKKEPVLASESNTTSPMSSENGKHGAEKIEKVVTRSEDNAVESSPSSISGSDVLRVEKPSTKSRYKSPFDKDESVESTHAEVHLFLASLLWHHVYLLSLIYAEWSSLC